MPTFSDNVRCRICGRTMFYYDARTVNGEYYCGECHLKVFGDKGTCNMERETEAEEQRICNGCRFLAAEDWARGKTAHVCKDPESPKSGRVVGNPGPAEYAGNEKIMRPAWCKEKH